MYHIFHTVDTRGVANAFAYAPPIIIKMHNPPHNPYICKCLINQIIRWVVVWWWLLHCLLAAIAAIVTCSPYRCVVHVYEFNEPPVRHAQYGSRLYISNIQTALHPPNIPYISRGCPLCTSPDGRITYIYIHVNIECIYRWSSTWNMHLEWSCCAKWRTYIPHTHTSALKCRWDSEMRG